MVAGCFLPELAPTLILLGALTVGLWHRSFGPCKRCETSREPKCGCPGGTSDEPQIRRPRFKGKDDYR